MKIDSIAAKGEAQADSSAWKEMVARYQKSDVWRSTWQMVNTLVPYCLLWYLMYHSMSVSYWLTLPLAILAGGFLARSFFKSRRANDMVGFITGVLVFTPYYLWRWEHSVHHASSGDLDERGLGDVW